MQKVWQARAGGQAEVRGALLEGEVSPRKLARIASVATAENESEMLEAARSLSRRAVDVFVKDIQTKNAKANGFCEPKNEAKCLAGRTFRIFQGAGEEAGGAKKGGCEKPAAQIHHVRKFAFGKNDI